MEFNTWRVLENVKILGRVFDEVEERNCFQRERDCIRLIAGILQPMLCY